MGNGMQQVLQRRLDDVDQEVSDLREMLELLRMFEREPSLRARLREVDLGFRLQDVFAGRITGEGLRRALAKLQDIAYA